MRINLKLNSSGQVPLEAARARKRSLPLTGQAMVLTVMLLSGAILSATSIVGLLMVYSVRHAGDAINSTKAFAAADSGLQCVLMRHKEGSTRDCGTKDAPITLSDSKATYYVEEITDADGNVIARSTGVSNRVARSLSTSF